MNQGLDVAGQSRANCRLQPLTVRDFMNYLIYVERSAENLQFYLWHQDYVKRFPTASASELALSPEWTQAMEDDIAARLQREATENLRRLGAGAEIFEGTDFEKKQAEVTTVAVGASSDALSMVTPSDPVSNATTVRSQAREAFVAAGAKAPCKCTQQTVGRTHEQNPSLT